MGVSSCQCAPAESLTLEIPPDLNPHSIADPASFTNRYLVAQEVLVAQTLLSVRFCTPLVHSQTVQLGPVPNIGPALSFCPRGAICPRFRFAPRRAATCRG